jgi:flavin-dependent dehydrogenase
MIEVPHAPSVDVAIVGAGPAGAATARRLALQGPTVALIERSRFEIPRVGESLAPAVQPLLMDLGVWSAFLSLHPLPSYGTRALWGDATPVIHSHLASPWGCGWHVDRCAFDRMLAEAAQQAGAAVFDGTTCVGCIHTSEAWTLTLRPTGENHGDRTWQLHARVVIDATGRSARLASWTGASRVLLDHLVGVATLFDRVDTGDNGHVMVETAADGWWYSAPVCDGRMMAMLMTDGDLCGRGDFASRPVWQAHLQAADATHSRLADATAAWGPRVFCALSQRLRRKDWRPPWLAVGDAALAVDPISGSGVVRALGTARAAAESVGALLEGQARGAIEDYESDRDRECTSYLHERAAYYGIEQRWQQSAFWQRRAVAAAHAAAT